MTEVVTNSAASLQQTLVAERQQRAFGVSGSNSDTNTQPNPAVVKPQGAARADAVARAAKPDQSQADGRGNQQPAPEQKIKRTVPDPADLARSSKSESRSEAVKVELKDFDVGRRPAEVVGTADVVQRFDNNLDGRVDLLESQRAARARDSSFTYAARGQARSETPTVAEQTQDRAVERSVQDQPASESAAPAQSVPAGQPGQSAETGQPAKKLFDSPQVVSGGTSDDGTVPEKIFGSDAVAEQGGFSDGAPVQQKLYGDGAEVVVGRFAADAAAPQKLSDKVDVPQPGRFTEDGTGEQKLYDKVAQSEPGQFYEDQGERKLYSEEDLPQPGPGGEDGVQEETLYEKAQRLEAEQAAAQGDVEQPKKIYGELELYADVAEYGDETVQLPVTGVGPVSA